MVIAPVIASREGDLPIGRGVLDFPVLKRLGCAARYILGIHKGGVGQEQSEGAEQREGRLAEHFWKKDRSGPAPSTTQMHRYFSLTGAVSANRSR